MGTTISTYLKQASQKKLPSTLLWYMSPLNRDMSFSFSTEFSTHLPTHSQHNRNYSIPSRVPHKSQVAIRNSIVTTTYSILNLLAVFPITNTNADTSIFFFLFSRSYCAPYTMSQNIDPPL